MATEIVSIEEARTLSRTGHFVQAEMGSYQQDGITVIGHVWNHRVDICEACDNGREYAPIPVDPEPTQMDLPF